MVKRDHYLNQIRPFFNSDLIKIITGIRRCGKSTILGQLRDEAAQFTDNIIYLEFENRRVKSELRTADDVIKYVDSNRKEGKCFIFFDEIQEVEDWPEICQTLRLEDNSVFITGSNSKLLSSEFTKMLSGRYVAFRIRPFVYKELLTYADELSKEISVSDYLIWGGFPKRVEFDGQALKQYLNDLDETIIFKDIVVRYKIRKEELFRAVADYVLRSNSRIISANSIYSAVKQKYPCSVNTIMKYISYLEDAYAINRIKLFSTKTKQELSFYYKYYDEDVSLNSIRNANSRFDIDHNLENIVYNELSYMNYDLSVYNNNGKEIDFLAVKGNKEYFIQVAHSVVDEKAYKREFSAFAGLDNSRLKILITNDEIDYSTSVVRHIKLKDFLLLDSLE